LGLAAHCAGVAPVPSEKVAPEELEPCAGFKTVVLVEVVLPVVLDAPLKVNAPEPFAEMDCTGATGAGPEPIPANAGAAMTIKPTEAKRSLRIYAYSPRILQRKDFFA
jgi:hypothetical protein